MPLGIEGGPELRITGVMKVIFSGDEVTHDYVLFGTAMVVDPRTELHRCAES